MNDSTKGGCIRRKTMSATPLLTTAVVATTIGVMSSNPRTLGERLTYVRKLAVFEGKELSGRALARLAGLPESLVGYLERGERTNPEATTLIALSDTTSASVDYLLKGDGDPPTPEEVQRAIDRAARLLRAAETRAAG